MKAEVLSWLIRAGGTTKDIENAIQEFKVLSNTYEGIRNVGFEDDEKEAIDMAYVKLNEIREELCGIQAGGKRKRGTRRKATKKNKRSSL